MNTPNTCSVSHCNPPPPPPPPSSFNRLMLPVAGVVFVVLFLFLFCFTVFPPVRPLECQRKQPPGCGHLKPVLNWSNVSSRS